MYVNMRVCLLKVNRQFRSGRRGWRVRGAPLRPRHPAAARASSSPDHQAGQVSTPTYLLEETSYRWVCVIVLSRYKASCVLSIVQRD